MNDLRTAAQQALERLRKYHYGNGFIEDAECIAELEAALAQQAEPVEPVAWEGWWLHHGQHNYRAKPLTSERVKELMKLAFEVGREAAPPQRLPLTDQEIDRIRADCVLTPHEYRDRAYGWALHFARAIERAHGIEEKK